MNEIKLDWSTLDNYQQFLKNIEEKCEWGITIFKKV